MTVLLITLLVVQSFALGGLVAWVIVVGRMVRRTELHADHIRAHVSDIGLKVSQIRLHAALGGTVGVEDGG